MKHLAHPLIAIAIQLLVFVTFGNWWLGAVVVTIAYLFRETTQAEYRWIGTYGGGLRANMPTFAAFDPRVWREWKPWLDWLLPMAATVCLAWWMS